MKYITLITILFSINISLSQSEVTLPEVLGNTYSNGVDTITFTNKVVKEVNYRKYKVQYNGDYYWVVPMYNLDYVLFEGFVNVDSFTVQLYTIENSLYLGDKVYSKIIQ